jgi:oligoribonuclease
MIVWIDTETTGVDYDKEELLEIAVVITTDDLKILDFYGCVIKPNKRKMNKRMNAFVRQMHTDSGLLKALEKGEGRSVRAAEITILEMLNDQKLGNGLLLGGNSVHFDRRILETRMPRLMARFTHQNLDVSAVGNLVKKWTPHVYEHIKAKTKSKKPHRAMADILGCIESLAEYREMVFTTEKETELIGKSGL